MVNIIIGSLNKVKLEAVLNAADALGEFFGNYEIDTIKVESFPQPYNEQVKEGAIIRAKLAYKYAEVKYRGKTFFCVGIEGGIVNFLDINYITAYCHVIKSNEEAHGSWTAFLEVPPEIKRYLDDNCELGEVIMKVRAEKKWSWNGGAFGTLTAENYKRLDSLSDAMILAFSSFFIKP
ncbi:MAG: DUF84 family protein [Candidatus Hodarchaeota archaeon]